MLKFTAWLAAGALLLGLAAPQPAEATTPNPASSLIVHATIKVFNHSKYRFRLTGIPLRDKSRPNFITEQPPPAAKGQQVVKFKDIQFYRSKPGAASTDARIALDLFKDGNMITCYVAVAYGKATGLFGLGFELGVGPPERQGCEGIKVDWQISQNDLELYIDLPLASWDLP
jgi:hypothetical protein